MYISCDLYLWPCGVLFSLPVTSSPHHSGRYDDDGSFYITDRLKELIKVKGLQVAPAELEAVLVSHPKISDAAVTSVPDERQGEAPKAFVVKKEEDLTEKDVMEYMTIKVRKHMCSLILSLSHSLPPPPPPPPPSS